MLNCGVQTTPHQLFTLQRAEDESSFILPNSPSARVPSPSACWTPSDLLCCFIFKPCSDLMLQCKVQWGWHWCEFQWLPKSGNLFIPVTWKYKIRSFSVTKLIGTCWMIIAGFAREKQGVKRQGNAFPSLQTPIKIGVNKIQCFRSWQKLPITCPGISSTGSVQSQSSKCEPCNFSVLGC